uniref:Peptidase M41 FtsH extracellular domain-containing protein n=1 Tax=Oryza meridionalis TaxID=40149 RepID=A0A0E0EKF7_9ORYZ
MAAVVVVAACLSPVCAAAASVPRTRWRAPVCAKVEEVYKDKEVGLGFRKPARRRMRLWRCAVRRVPPAVAAPIVLAVLLLAARFALPKNAAKEVAYSDLLAGLRAGAVTVVAFEEESHRIYFHRVVDDGGGGKDVDTGASEACRSAAESRWPCYARSVPHDEGFLLGLMRDGGADYRSVPQLAAGRLLVDMLNTLLTLWEERRRRRASAVMIGEAAGEVEGGG